MAERLNGGRPVAAAAAAALSHAWEYVDVGVDSQFRAISVVDAQCIWLAGMDGRVLRSTDAGLDWSECGPSRAEGLELRGIVAFDALTAVVMCPGPGEAAALFLTEDGGATWSCAHRATSPDCYLDGIAFLDRSTGIAIGDPVDGAFTVLRTSDGGRSWKQSPPDRAPRALPGEGAYAASGSCIVAADRAVWFGTGGAAPARVFRSDDAGATWRAHETGMRSGPMAGVFGLHFADDARGFAVGGDHSDQFGATPAVAYTTTGGTNWSIGRAAGPTGYRSAVAVLPGSPQTIVVVGQPGSDISTDGGLSWRSLGDGFHTIGTAPDGSCWAAGEGGRVARLVENPI